MPHWKTTLKALALDTEAKFDALKRSLARRLRIDDPYQVVPYRGFGNAERLHLSGRVLRDHPVAAAGDRDSLWRNLHNTYRRLESDEVPGARVAVTFRDQTQEVTSDEEGYFSTEIVLEKALRIGERTRVEVDLELIEPQHDLQTVTATGEVTVPTSTARFGVISDLDDTVLQTGATRLLQMARNTFLENSRTRLPFPGVAALYQALNQGQSGHDGNPMFYVSSSPWNLYELLRDFLRLQSIPLGPMFLRDWGWSESGLAPLGSHRDHKIKPLIRLFEFYPDLSFILVGDSGQEDPEIYHELVHRYPERVLAVYVRDVTGRDDRREAIEELAREVAEAGSSLVLAGDSMAIARHAAEHGFIDEADLAAVAGEKEKDEGEPSAIEVLLEEDDVPETVVVEDATPEEAAEAVKAEAETTVIEGEG